KQLNTWVSFQSAEQPLLGQFSVSGNRHSSSLRNARQKPISINARSRQQRSNRGQSSSARALPSACSNHSTHCSSWRNCNGSACFSWRGCRVRIPLRIWRTSGVLVGSGKPWLTCHCASAARRSLRVLLDSMAA
ncbi:hypothetical protein C5H37_14395, partial [Pseudomonas aeruginosa]